MRILFKGTVHPSAIAKDIKKALAARGVSVGQRRCEEILARMCGYAGWHELRLASLAPDAEHSPKDEAIGEPAAAERRRRFVGVLSEFAGIPSAIAAEVVDEVRPTGARIHPDAVADLIGLAVRKGATDIHIEPRRGAVFFRELGVLRHVAQGPERRGTTCEMAALIPQIERRAGIGGGDRPRRGSFRIACGGRSVELRIATVPSPDGETMVLRMTDPGRPGLRLEDLGIEGLDGWRAGIGRRDGFGLCCGPDASGKTTALNATLREIDRAGRAIFRVEDPVASGVSFGSAGRQPLDPASTMRSILRAGADVVAIDEIDDAAKVAVALMASRAGLGVVATVNAPDAPSALARLAALGPGAELSRMAGPVMMQSRPGKARVEKSPASAA